MSLVKKGEGSFFVQNKIVKKIFNTFLTHFAEKTGETWRRIEKNGEVYKKARSLEITVFQSLSTVGFGVP